MGEIKENKEKIEEEQLDEDTILEDPVDFDSVPIVLDASAARSKAKLMRKRSTERRLPASVLAKKKAAEKLKDILTTKIEAGSGGDESNVIEQIQKELIDASFQVDMSNPEYDLDNLDDEEKADLLAKQISKMDSSYVMKLLKKIEKGILDISIPMLMPFLRLQVKLKMGTNIFKGLEPQNKKKIVKENFINDMIEDITDIALLQEVIDRTQEKLNMLRPTNVIKSDNNSNYFSLEDDSFDLPSAPIRYVSPQREETPISTKASDHDLTYDNLLLHLKQISSLDGPNGIKTKKEATPTKSDETEEKDVRTANTNIPEVSDSKIEEKTEMSETEGKKSDDEGFPSSEFDSSSDEDKEENKDTE